MSVAGIVVGWLAFAGQHMYMSHPSNRRELVEKLGGNEKYLAVYSGLSFATLVPLSLYYGFRARNSGAVFNNPLTKIPGNKALSFILKISGAVAAAQAFNTPSPTGLAAQQQSSNPTISAANQGDVTGILRITRHPLFMSFALWGLGNCFTAVHATNFVFWSGFPIFWVIGSAHQDMRKREQLPASFFEKTSLLPFGAVIRGKQSAEQAFKEMNPVVSAAGVGAAVALMLLPKVLQRRKAPTPQSKA